MRVVAPFPRFPNQAPEKAVRFGALGHQSQRDSFVPNGVSNNLCQSLKALPDPAVPNLGSSCPGRSEVSSAGCRTPQAGVTSVWKSNARWARPIGSIGVKPFRVLFLRRLTCCTCEARASGTATLVWRCSPNTRISRAPCGGVHRAATYSWARSGRTARSGTCSCRAARSGT